jgi:hypothetical protein
MSFSYSSGAFPKSPALDNFLKNPLRLIPAHTPPARCAMATLSAGFTISQRCQRFPHPASADDSIGARAASELRTVPSRRLRARFGFMEGTFGTACFIRRTLVLHSEATALLTKLACYMSTTRPSVEQSLLYMAWFVVVPQTAGKRRPLNRRCCNGTNSNLQCAPVQRSRR